MTDYTEKYAEYAGRVKIRPNPKANRPRTKQRPEHKNAVTGMIIGVDRGRYTVHIANGANSRTVLCARAREMHKTALVIGDSVQVVGDISGQPGTLARIVRLNPRTTLLRRSADDSDQIERIMVANVTQLLIVVAAANPTPRAGFVDRSLAAAYDAGITPILCVTKTDLQDPSDFIAHFAALDLQVVTRTKNTPIDTTLTALLAGQKTVFIGHSGVGKSTLINQLVPEAARATGAVNQVTGRGRHTSSSARAFALTNSDSWIIDTPGVRSFGLGHVTAERIIASFADLQEYIASCPRGCDHAAVAPDCELNLQSESLLPAQKARLLSLRRLIGASNTPETPTT